MLVCVIRSSLWWPGSPPAPGSSVRDIDTNFYAPDGSWVGFTEWAFFDEPVGNYKRIALTDERDTRGWWISTVWLGPVVRQYETLVFGGPRDQWRTRYATSAAALAGHDQVVAEVLALDGAVAH